ncbi:Pyruvate decarboxylase 2 [Branchiostoma belcheri]|nr:Pyruvate decarboxylase 2 [Branchiostoma belcheri]
MFRLTNPKRRKPRAHVLKAEGYLCDIIKTTRRTPDGGCKTAGRTVKLTVNPKGKSKLKSADENTQFQDNTAQQFLYQQQPEQSQHHDARTMWWHPLMRKWPKSNEIKFKFKYTRGGGEEVRLLEVAGVPSVQEPGDHHEAERVQQQPEPEEAARGSKKAMDRISVLFGCNMTGTDKLTPLMIGSSKNPRCVRGQRVPLPWYANKKAWMTGEIFREEMGRKGKKICLLLDNCTAHPHDVNLRNIRLIFLPANTTSIIQPLDQGIVRNFKALYRSQLMQRILNDLDNGNIYTAHSRKQANREVTAAPNQLPGIQAADQCSAKLTKEDLGMIQCQECQSWYHHKCMSVPESENWEKLPFQCCAKNKALVYESVPDVTLLTNLSNEPNSKWKVHVKLDDVVSLRPIYRLTSGVVDFYGSVTPPGRICRAPERYADVVDLAATTWPSCHCEDTSSAGPVHRGRPADHLEHWLRKRAEATSIADFKKGLSGVLRIGSQQQKTTQLEQQRADLERWKDRALEAERDMATYTKGLEEKTTSIRTPKAQKSAPKDPARARENTAPANLPAPFSKTASVAYEIPDRHSRTTRVVREARGTAVPGSPVLAVTATASKLHRRKIQTLLSMEGCIELVENPDRANIKLHVSHAPLNTTFDWLLQLERANRKDAPCPICTTAASMGINFAGVDNVVNFGPPQELEQVVYHRLPNDERIKAEFDLKEARKNARKSVAMIIALHNDMIELDADRNAKTTSVSQTNIAQLMTIFENLMSSYEEPAGSASTQLLAELLMCKSTKKTIVTNNIDMMVCKFSAEGSSRQNVQKDVFDKLCSWMDDVEIHSCTVEIVGRLYPNMRLLASVLMVIPDSTADKHSNPANCTFLQQPTQHDPTQPT